MDNESFELTMEQEFHMKLMEESAHNMTREQMLDTLIQASRLLMMKDNVIRGLVKHCRL